MDRNSKIYILCQEANKRSVLCTFFCGKKRGKSCQMSLEQTEGKATLQIVIML